MIQRLVSLMHRRGILSCEKKAKSICETFRGNLINIGGGARGKDAWPNALNIDAEHGTVCRDFNTFALPFPSGSFDNAICEQVIEHLHNTTFFLSECHRILKPGGNLLISTENLGSLPNIFALLCGIAPFSVQPCCGEFVGGWKTGAHNAQCSIAANDPAFSGCRGHVRVLTNGQLRILLNRAGFTVLQCFGFALNHYILFHARKMTPIP